MSPTDRWCGVAVIDLEAGVHVGSLVFTGVVEEIFDVQLLPWRWPEITPLDTELLDRSFLLPPDPQPAEPDIERTAAT